MPIRFRAHALACLLGGLILAAPLSRAAETVQFAADDGVKIFADLHLAEDAEAGPVLLLFHQGGGDGRGEYAPLVPRLLEAGFSVLVVDQRTGGSVFGGENRTMAGLLAAGGEEPGYCDAYPDLVASLAWIEERGFEGPVLAWGSSYSAALVLKLAGEEADRLAAVLAFSPASGEPMRGCSAETFADGVAVPALALRPASEVSRPDRRASFDALADAGLETYISHPGAHGSSMLVAERIGGEGVTRDAAQTSAEETWRVVADFLAAHAGP